MARRQRTDDPALDDTVGTPDQDQPVILDHDGGVDDFIALVILASAQVNARSVADVASSQECPRHRLLAVTVVEADCFAQPCVEVCRRVLALYAPVCPALARVPVAASPLRGTAAPFPNEWRKDCICMRDFPILNTPAVETVVKGNALRDERLPPGQDRKSVV